MSFTTQSENRAMAQMNITPLVDVMLVLLVIFMVTAPTLNHIVPLSLPQRCNAADCNKPDQTEPSTLRVLADGQLVWDNATLAREALSEQLRLHSKRGAALNVASADEARYSDLVEVFAQISKAGIKQVQMTQ